MTKACYLILSSGRPFASHTATLGPHQQYCLCPAP